jgi:hypothetical protein
LRSSNERIAAQSGQDQHALKHAQGFGLPGDGQRLDGQLARNLYVSLLGISDAYIGEQRGLPAYGLWIEQGQCSLKRG